MIKHVITQLLVYLSSANKSKLVHYRGTFGFVQSAFVSCQTKEFLMRKKLQPGFCPRLPPSQKKEEEKSLTSRKPSLTQTIKLYKTPTDQYQ